MMETSLKSKSFSDDSDDMVNRKHLPPRDVLYQDVQFKPKVDPRPANLDGFRDNWPLETTIAEVRFKEFGIDVKPDASYQSVLLPTDKETPSRKPKDEFQRQSMVFGTKKDLQELLEFPIQLTSGMHEALRKQIKKDILKDSEVLVLKHKNITKVLGPIQQGNEEGHIKMSQLMEYEDSALNVFMARHCDLQECDFIQLAKHGLRGLEYMHHIGMNHFGVMPENLLVTSVNNSLLMKLADFGTSKLAEERISLSGWIPEYMAPEIARFVLQQLSIRGLSWNVKESDVTGKADVFPMAMSIMYMYCKAHVLMKLITRGETTYNHMGVKERQIKQTELLIMLATEKTFVQLLIPDNCCLEMQSLLKLMTEHDPKQRYSSKEACSYIEEYQQKEVQATDHALKLKATQQAVAKENQVSTEKMGMQSSVPETATTILQADLRPVNNSLKQKLRNKLRPYTKPPPSPPLAVPMTPVEELNKLSLQQAKEPEHGDHVVQSGMEYHAVVRQPVRLIIPQTVEILNVSDQQPLKEDQQNEMQPAIPTPSLFGGEVDFSVYDSGEGLFESNHQSLRQVTDDSSRSRAFDENEVPGI